MSPHKTKAKNETRRTFRDEEVVEVKARLYLPIFPTIMTMQGQQLAV